MYDIAKMIADDVVKIWNYVNSRLPLHDKYCVVKLVDQMYFKIAREINWKCLTTVQVQNMEDILEKLSDISSCICKPPFHPCDDKAVICYKINWKT